MLNEPVSKGMRRPVCTLDMLIPLVERAYTFWARHRLKVSGAMRSLGGGSACEPGPGGACELGAGGAQPGAAKRAARP